MAPIYKTVHYRKFHSEKFVDATFQGILLQELNRTNEQGTKLWGRIADRVWKTPPREGCELILNRVADLQTGIFGEACLVDPEGAQAFLELAEKDAKLSNISSAQIYDLQEQNAPANARYVRGILYFLIIENHVFFIQLHGISGDSLQPYFWWLLRNHPSVSASNFDGKLQAVFDPAEVGGKLDEVRQVRVKGNSAPHVDIALARDDLKPKERETLRKAKETLVTSEKAESLARTIFGESLTDRLIKSLGPKEHLEVDASLKIRGTRTTNSRSVMNDLATAAAAIEGTTVHIAGKDGVMKDNDVILRVNMPFELANERKSLLDFDNVADQLQKTYLRFVEDKKISA